MGIFHSYVSLPEGIFLESTTSSPFFHWQPKSVPKSGAILQAVLPSVLGTFPGAEKVPFFGADQLTAESSPKWIKILCKFGIDLNWQQAKKGDFTWQNRTFSLISRSNTQQQKHDFIGDLTWHTGGNPPNMRMFSHHNLGFDEANIEKLVPQICGYVPLDWWSILYILQYLYALILLLSLSFFIINHY